MRKYNKSTFMPAYPRHASGKGSKRTYMRAGFRSDASGLDIAQKFYTFLYSKKWSLFMTALLAAMLTVAPVAEASNYVVQKGDTLTKIAKLHNTTVSQLQKWNNLKAESIYVSQKLIVSAPKVTTKKPTATTNPIKVTAPKPTTAKPTPVMTSNAVVYNVQPNDNLTKIAKVYSVSVENIKLWNKLTTDAIFVGQSLKIITSAKNSAPTAPSNGTTSPNNNVPGNVNGEESVEEIGKQQIIEANAKIAAQLAKEKMITNAPSASRQAIYTKAVELAKSFIGTPYIFGGATPDGFDCSGFVQYVYNTAGYPISRLDSESYFMSSSTIVLTPVAGDLVFFKNTYKAGISHMGIYIGDGQFIHAGSNGVEMSKLSYNYWDTRFVAFKRFN